MTTRQRAIAIIGTRTRQAVVRQAELNSEPVHAVPAAEVRNFVRDCSQRECSPDFFDFCNAVDEAGNWARFENAVIREVEYQCDVRKGWWSGS